MVSLFCSFKNFCNHVFEFTCNHKFHKYGFTFFSVRSLVFKFVIFSVPILIFIPFFFKVASDGTFEVIYKSQHCNFLNLKKSNEIRKIPCSYYAGIDDEKGGDKGVFEFIKCFHSSFSGFMMSSDDARKQGCEQNTKTSDEDFFDQFYYLGIILPCCIYLGFILPFRLSM